ncbi:hypothetical protein [Massilia sp. DD77]|uniref:hypothetical protein n=1 Tax=Massilia sp. DD77 TaxID=3109349 RepID=UPI002FFD70DA
MNTSRLLFAGSLTLTLTLTLLGTAVPSQAQVAASAGDARPAILRALDGSWRMAGDVRGKPVTYAMTAAPALNGTFTEMRMKDVQVPARYEAVVFIGVDPASQAVIAHWIDSFGPKHSIPHATGRIAGNTIQLLFPYQGGDFRNALSYDPDTASWTFVLESAQPDGSWKHFARYEVRRN